MNNTVHISGLGIISAIGNDVATNLDALLNERTGIAPRAKSGEGSFGARRG